MKTLATLTNVIAFLALFVAYANVGLSEKPSGVRRALQTYSGQLYAEATPPQKPTCKNGLKTGAIT